MTRAMFLALYPRALLFLAAREHRWPPAVENLIVETAGDVR